MEQQIFTVWDSAAGAYLDPFVAPSIEFAIRSFRQAVNTPDHNFQRYPEDYTLFHIGSFSVQTGLIDPQPPNSMGVAITFLNRPEGAE